MSLEFLRRASREYDRYILNQAQQHHQRNDSPGFAPVESAAGNSAVKVATCATDIPYFRPSVLQQIIRALFHMVQFAVAYFIMLLAMYYNGYIIICIIIGAFLGALVFSWEQISLR